jgi:cytochrome c biogenesis protein CcdA
MTSDQRTPGSTATVSESNTMSIIAIVLGVLAVFIAPIILGPIGIILAVIAKRRGERLSTTALIVAIAGMVLGFILGAIVYNSMVK